MTSQPAPANSEEAIALELADRHHARLRYVAKWSRWMLFEDGRWTPEATLWIHDQARAFCRSHAVLIAAESPREARKLASSTTVNGVVSLLRADRRMVATVDQWDRDPMLLNTPAGVVDLRTGAIRTARPDDYCTKMTAAPPSVGLESECPIWEAFLAKVTKQRKELVGFLRRVCGYVLTGRINEEALFFFYGTGGNGKSKFLGVLAGILGDYHTKAAISTFIASKNEQHPTDIAKLMGARLVTAVETEEGRRWAEAKIKEMTGGDRLTGRFMRQDFFDFDPQFKLLIAGNHKPGLRSVDIAMRRRFNLVPFEVSIPKDEQDKDLADKLRAEWPSILSWMIAGCVEWQQDGLGAPGIVTKATDEYMDAEDAVAAWLDESATIMNDAFETRAALYASWKQWGERNGEWVGSNKQFVQVMEARQFQPHTRVGKRGFLGLELHTTRDEREAQKQYEDRRYA